MPNNTACSPFGNCTIIDGVRTNGTIFTPPYDATYPVPHWHQNMELATICVFNSLSLIVIAARLLYRRKKFNMLKGDDIWMAIAGLLLIGLYASQLGAVRFGSGLHMQNVPHYWREMHWHFQTGFSAYYLVVSCIKLSVCFCFLQILTHNLKGLRYCVYGLCVVTGSLGLVCAIPWNFGCQPFLSNFYWSVTSESCINYDIFRWLWISVSVPIDIAIMSVPLRILNRVRLRAVEKRILQMVFCATLLGTICCIIGIYGSYKTRTVESQQLFYNETPFIMMNDIEIFAYTLGASFPVLSGYIVTKADRPNPPCSNFTSWARYVPDLFLSSPLNINLPSRTATTTTMCAPTKHPPIKYPTGHPQPSSSSNERDDLPLSASTLCNSGAGSSLSSCGGNVDLEKHAAQDA
ncbi:uncharacterized protein L3040_002108 [Drepanopeziza brunnea f. sp. 'multigermtubi']|uniref:uncharacterized protein n=1 Tax=Drepanopeziza brunnea f. sp. 'multigermtubi' TaxID=698441 RepID=UPI00238970FC|nr:hypothetical protein L3040_002108 [Drepanopeziza brunnea f. sp. 'multigermtubi']